MATEEDYNFLYVNLMMKKNMNDMFIVNSPHKIEVV